MLTAKTVLGLQFIGQIKLFHLNMEKTTFKAIGERMFDDELGFRFGSRLQFIFELLQHLS